MTPCSAYLTGWPALTATAHSLLQVTPGTVQLSNYRQVYETIPITEVSDSTNEQRWWERHLKQLCACAWQQFIYLFIYFFLSFFLSFFLCNVPLALLPKCARKSKTNLASIKRLWAVAWKLPHCLRCLRDGLFKLIASVGMGLRTFSSFRGRNAHRRAWNISRIDSYMHFAKYFPDSLAFHVVLTASKSFVVLANQKRVGIAKKMGFF